MVVRVLSLFVALCVLGCGLSEEQVREKAGDVAVSAKKAADVAQDSLSQAYDSAVAKGQTLAKQAGEIWDDNVLRAKVLTGFKLVKDLRTDDVTVEVKNGLVYLSGSVPTAKDKMIVEGIVYGITGDLSKLKSSVVVAEK
jgi:osmotically-inducible protein OsmY